MATAPHHVLKGRKVAFDLSQSPLHWLPGDVESSHLVNGIHLLLPAGELWFCRVFNQALPLVTDEHLKQDVLGFVRQEANHAQAHRQGERWLRQHAIDIETAKGRAAWLIGQLLADRPLGFLPLPGAVMKQRWLIARVGLVAAIEHYTGLIGDWSMNSDGWDKGDAVVADLFRWHLAEEVEHRSVAFDLFEHLCRTRLGFYVSRQALIALVFPLFIYLLADTARALARQDADPRAQRMARMTVARMIWRMEWRGRRLDNTPTFSLLVERTLRWLAPSFDPEYEGDTQQALDYIARSPAALAGAKVA